MKMTDKRFWIFEGFTIVYAIAMLMLVITLSGKSFSVDFLLIFVGGSCISGAITWLLGNGKHWFVFGLIHEGFMLFMIVTSLWISAIAYNQFDPIVISIILYAMTAFVAISIIPTLALAYFGYGLFQKREEKTDAFSLGDIGINGIAYSRNRALKIAEIYYHSNRAILGGDVYKMENGRITLTLDSWYCDKISSESTSEYVRRCYLETTDYISKYPNNANFLFGFVVDAQD